MYHIVSDIHGEPLFVRKLVTYVQNPAKFHSGDTLVFNGDITGWKGAVLSQCIDLLWDVRRGKTRKKSLENWLSDHAHTLVKLDDELLKDAPSSAIFTAVIAVRYPAIGEILVNEQKELYHQTVDPIVRAVKMRKGKILYLSGNHENTTATDHDISNGWRDFKVLPLEQRFYHQMWQNGEMSGVTYVENFYRKGQVLFVGTNALLEGKIPDADLVKGVEMVVSHFPSPLGVHVREFPFSPIEDWASLACTATMKEILDLLHDQYSDERSHRKRPTNERAPLDKHGVRVVFGHYHISTAVETVLQLPPTITYMEGPDIFTWLRPAEIYPLFHI